VTETQPERPAERARSAAAHAKLNLRLRVFRPDDQGYHSIETLFLRTGLHDTVELQAAGPGIELLGTGDPTVPDGPENLCWLAAERFFAAVGRRPAVHIALSKRIPSGSGLGGGSADAAALLRLLNQSLNNPLSEGELLTVAGELGSDVPFAALGVPMALGWERGRRLLPLRPPGVRPALLVVPDFGIGSGEAYGWLRQDREAQAESLYSSGSSGGALPSPGKLTDWNALRMVAMNDFEGPVFARHPELREARQRLLAEGAQISQMTGSGSAVFAVFSNAESRDGALAGADWPAGWSMIPVDTPV
jgi:4-diphosphocytidyl-2-C-methyl-D-erythritol kinase